MHEPPSFWLAGCARLCFPERQQSSRRVESAHDAEASRQASGGAIPSNLVLDYFGKVTCAELGWDGKAGDEIGTELTNQTCEDIAQSALMAWSQDGDGDGDGDTVIN